MSKDAYELVLLSVTGIVCFYIGTNEMDTSNLLLHICQHLLCRILHLMTNEDLVISAEKMHGWGPNVSPSPRAYSRNLVFLLDRDNCQKNQESPFSHDLLKQRGPCEI